LRTAVPVSESAQVTSDLLLRGALVSAAIQDPIREPAAIKGFPAAVAHAFDAVFDPVVVIGPDERVVHANKHARKLFGHPVAAWRGMSAAELLADSSRQRYRRVYAKLTSGGARSRRVELEGQDRLGRVFPIALVSSLWSHDQTNYVVYTIRDLTARRQRERENEALLVATASLGAQAEPEEVLRTLVRQAAALLDAGRALYAVLRGDRIIIRGRWSSAGWDNRDYEPRRTGVLALVWESRQPFRSNDLLHDPRTNASTMSDRGLHSQLTVPLIAGDGERLGAVTLYNSARPEGFSDHDERVLLGICETAAAILRRARDTERRLEAQRAVAVREREAQALLAVAERLNGAAEPDDVRRRIAQIGAETLAVRRATVTTNKGGYGLCGYEYCDGASARAEVRLPIDASIAGWVMRKGRSWSGEALGNGQEPAGSSFEQHAGTNVLAVPVMSRPGGVVEVLTFFDRFDGRAFTEDDRRLAEGIAHHASVALERTTLVQQLRDRERTLHHQAVTDPLTGLPNRRHFLDRLVHLLERQDRRGPGVSVLFLDLDGFKVVNDSLGHAAGDELLREVADRLLTGKRSQDMVGPFRRRRVRRAPARRARRDGGSPGCRAPYPAASTSISGSCS
jgi:PAS domain S-box-containing protein